MTEPPRLIVITGCTRGLGRALLDAYHAAGYRLAGCGRDDAKLDELRALTGESENFTQVDVTNAKQVQDWASELIARNGAPDLLICNAGVINEHADFCDHEPEVWERLMRVNVLGVVHTLRAFAPAMMARKQGVLTAFSSGAGIRGYRNIAPYCMSKHAVEGVMKSLATEMPDTMASVPVQPGVINTDMLQQHYGDRADEQASPERWAKVAAPFLLGLGPEHNGQSLRIEGY